MTGGDEVRPHLHHERREAHQRTQDFPVPEYDPRERVMLSVVHILIDDPADSVAIEPGHARVGNLCPAGRKVEGHGHAQHVLPRESGAVDAAAPRCRRAGQSH